MKERPRASRKESRWQREAKDMFYKHALPVIKIEGAKYLTKQFGTFLSKHQQQEQQQQQQQQQGGTVSQ